MKRAVHVVGTNVRDGHYVDIGRVERADQHAPFIARANHADANRIGHGAVAEIHRTQTGTRYGSGRDHTLEEIAAIHAAAIHVFGLVHRPQGFVVIVLSDFLFFRREVHECFSCLAC